MIQEKNNKKPPSVHKTLLFFWIKQVRIQQIANPIATISNVYYRGPPFGFILSGLEFLLAENNFQGSEKMAVQ